MTRPPQEPMSSPEALTQTELELAHMLKEDDRSAAGAARVIMLSIVLGFIISMASLIGIVWKGLIQ